MILADGYKSERVPSDIFNTPTFRSLFVGSTIVASAWGRGNSSSGERGVQLDPLKTLKQHLVSLCERRGGRARASAHSNSLLHSSVNIKCGCISNAPCYLRGIYIYIYIHIYTYIYLHPPAVLEVLKRRRPPELPFAYGTLPQVTLKLDSRYLKVRARILS